MSLKTCCRCKLEKSVEEFFKTKQNKDGLQNACKTCLSEDQRTKRAANPEKYRIQHVARTYKVTIQAATELVRREQTDPCEICGRMTKLHVDHIHGTDIVAGLLCPPCNMAIGLLQESSDVITRAALYVRTRKECR